ncbi:ABC transporter substrate-binding protein [Aphanothece hegewaldii CCALA 016]|uniref:ABC transporter substrate-binding protein n=1 Tax=Aphanothece hegewaldii CCALA 016 TaxID=2107694 RepID=A0A2T1LYB5_9CHRO|nr:transporter substrate-binding domain-containing protein [Aphanothece hegewaldii]PSF37354.1 ABC transporter substrate-binding protein [Aphanothece hegewaldii CCALA 016]
MLVSRIFNTKKISNLAFILISILGLFSNSALAAELEEILKRGQLIVAVKDNVRPLGFKDSQGNLQGFEIDIARNLAQELLGDPDAVVFKPVSNLERIPVLLDGKVDLVIARVGQTSSRSRIVDLSNFYYLDGTSIVTKNPNLSLESLNNRKIAVLEGSGTIAILRSQLPTAQLIGVKSYMEAFALLESEQVEGFAADDSVLAGWIQDYPQYRLLPIALSGEPLCVVMPKGLQYESLRQKVNRAIAQWRVSGWLKERAIFWGLPITSVHRQP